MRLIKEIPHNEYKISVFSWNNKYIIKIESGMIEQTYKVSEWDLTGADEIDELVNELLTHQIDELFIQMSQKFQTSMENI